MSPQPPSDRTDRPSDAPTAARQTGPQRQLAQRVLALVKSLWMLVSTHRPVRIVVGLILLLVGIAGLFLPILQGVAIIIAALAILRKDFPLVERLWQRWLVPYERRFRHWLHTFRQRRAGRKDTDAGG